MISDWSTAMTFLAPDLAANMDNMPVPQPTSSTTCRMGSKIETQFEGQRLAQEIERSANLQDNLTFDPIY